MPNRSIESDLLIGGTFRPAHSGERLPVYDPATTEVVVEVAAAGEADVAEALAVARAAQPAWAARAPRDRGTVMLEAARAIRRMAAELAEIESIDTGKPLTQARADVEVSAQYFEFYGGLADKIFGASIPFEGDRFAVTFREPLGVTGHIIPWNYPLQIGSRTVAPALVSGNACVVKAAKEAPLTTLILGRVLLEAGLPAGVLNVLPGAGEVAGAALASSDEVDHISFTGGVQAGTAVMMAAARNVKPVTMELGGKSPSIVLDDARLELAVPVITKALIQNAGQTCSACSRVIVHESVHDRLLDMLRERFESVSLGRGLDDPDMGPLISATQYRGVVARTEAALDAGARLASGGGRREVADLGGYFVAPTLLDEVTPDMGVANDEVFGPVLAVLTVGSDDEAVAVADSTPYGLVTAVWSRDIDRALSMARRVESGQVYINSYGAGGGVALPFGGVKKSGFGREKGVEAVSEYTQVKTVFIDVAGPDAR